MSEHEKSPNMRREVITTIHPHDVVSGRGNENKANVHPGNVHFRNLVRRHKLEYVSSLKRDKPEFAKAIVHEIINKNPPGRFLKQEKASGHWYDIGYKQALTKTRQALREGASLIKRNKRDKMVQEETQQRHQQQLHQHQYQYPRPFQDQQRQYQQHHQYQHHQYQQHQHQHQHQDNLHQLLHSSNAIGSIGDGNIPRTYLLPGAQHVPQQQQIAPQRYVIPPHHVAAATNQQQGIIIPAPQHVQTQEAPLSLQIQEAQRSLHMNDTSHALQVQEMPRLPPLREDSNPMHFGGTLISEDRGGDELAVSDSNIADGSNGSHLSPPESIKSPGLDDAANQREKDDSPAYPKIHKSMDPEAGEEVSPIIRHYLLHMRQRKDRKEHQQKDTLDAMNALLHLKATRG